MEGEKCGLLTHLLHGSEIALRSRQSSSWSRDVPPFIYHVCASPCLQESGDITLSRSILIQFLCQDHDTITSFHFLSNYSFTSLLIEMQKRHTVKQNTLMLYSNVLHVLAYQNIIEHPYYRSLRNINTFATFKFYVSEILLIFFFHFIYYAFYWSIQGHPKPIGYRACLDKNIK